jgi:hypothetical protein
MFYWAITKRQLKRNEIRHDVIAGSVDIIVGYKFFCTTSNSKSATLLFEITVLHQAPLPILILLAFKKRVSLFHKLNNQTQIRTTIK